MTETETARETENNTETTQQRDPARMLIRLSAVLSVIMAVIAGVLIWNSRNAKLPVAGGSGPSIESDGSADSPDFTFTVDPLTKAPVTPPKMAAIVQDFELIDRSGRKVTNKDLLGRPWVASFIFINCAGPCPRVTGEMKLLQNRFGDKPVRLVTITVDPKRDTPERLANYADNFGADSDWLFLTKDQQTIYPLIHDSFGLTVQEETGPTRKPGWEITHSTRVVHVDATGHIRGKYNALDPVEMAQLVRELELEIKTLPPNGDTTATEGDDSDNAETPVEAPVPTAEEKPRG